MRKRVMMLAALGVALPFAATALETYVDAGDLPTVRQMHATTYDPATKTVYALGGNIGTTNGPDIAYSVGDSIGADHAKIDVVGAPVVSSSAQGPLMTQFRVNCGSTDDAVAAYNPDGALFYNGRVYMTPSNSNASAPWGVNQILMCSVDGTGALTGTWTDASAANPAPAPTAGQFVFDAGWEIYNGRIYRAAGRQAAPACTNGSATIAGGNVVSAPINGDGTIGAWRTETVLPVSYYWGALFITADTAVFVGGYDGASRFSSVYTAPVNSTTGVIGTWTLSANAYPQNIFMLSGCVDGNKVIVLTGRTDGGAGVTASYEAEITGGVLGPWEKLADLPVTTGHRYGASGGGNGVYVVTGGRDDAASTVLLNSVWVIKRAIPADVEDWMLY